MHWKNNPPTGDVCSEAKLWFTPATQGRRWKRLPAISAPQAYPSWIGKKLGLWARWEGRRPQPAPFRTWGETGQHRHFPTPCRLFPHPPQNRLPRGARASVALCRAGLGSRLGWCWALPTGSGTRGSRRDQVLLSLPQNRRKHGFSPVSFLHVLHGYVVRVGLKSGFSHLVLSVPNRSHPLHHPKRTRLRLFGLCRVRFALFILF